jgi:thiol-disulfide isomerase/thioredoxin
MKNKIKYFVISALMNMVFLSIIRGFVGMDIACVLAIILYFSMTYLVFTNLYKEKLGVKLLIILIGTLTHVPMKIIDFKSQLVSFPEFICEILGFILGILFFYSNKIGRVISVSLMICISIFLTFKYEIIHNSLNYSNLFNKNTKQIKIDAVPYFDSNNVNINDKLFNPADLIVLNIWATSCGACIAEFPQIDSLYNLSLQSSKIKLYTACILQNGDRKSPYEIGTIKNTKFPIFTIPNWDYVIKEYGMDGVPVTFVIKNNEVLFRGTLLNAWGFAIEQN